MLVSTTYNTLHTDEKGIEAARQQVSTRIDSMIRTIEGSGFVLENLRETFLEAIEATVGEGGRGAGAGKLLSAVAEQYPEVPQEAWRDLMATIDSQYAGFEASQNNLIARIQEYDTRLGLLQYQPAVMLGGFPRLNLDEARQLVLMRRARDAVDSGDLETIKPFGDKEGG